MDGGRLYLDTASAAPVRREALEAAWPYLTGVFGNPSSHHSAGEAAAAGLADARSRVAAALGARRSDVTFTSGGSEAANLAIKGLALANPRGKHLVTSPIEHEAVLGSIDHLRRVHGFEVSFVLLCRRPSVAARAVVRVSHDLQHKGQPGCRLCGSATSRTSSTSCFHSGGN